MPSFQQFADISILTSTVQYCFQFFYDCDGWSLPPFHKDTFHLPCSKWRRWWTLGTFALWKTIIYIPRSSFSQLLDYTKSPQQSLCGIIQAFFTLKKRVIHSSNTSNVLAKGIPLVGQPQGASSTFNPFTPPFWRGFIKAFGQAF